MNIHEYIKFLRRAINNVEEVYFGNQNWIDSMLNVHNIKSQDKKREKLMPYLSMHNERVFCYELYHQLRKIMEENRLNEKVILQAELRKAQVSDEITQLFGVNSTDGVYYPDFLIHEPGTYENQDLIIEVKANPKLSTTDMLNDIKKIDQFINRYNYKKGIFLAINVNKERYNQLMTNDHLLNSLEEQINSKNEILLMFRESAKEPTISINLANLLQ
ncbi:hypothetical protein J18TS1_07320 [Oceanobacillus oncorhynchi subsp. incaldanensis]|uniref:Methionyl-tRNA formyltransferase-like protein n=2 Tax=Oceanobacillus TaxID=182709 RepID=A0A0A1MVZ9_9BACI|nr:MULTISPECIES: hypothetical protein [Bacillaceae]GIO17632.1 hypothetical protein J18TS1_07320 [Oceanobacillus oncorhynchi subsp. incaldanensis]CEI83016.1 hypothetical protein BN997_02905 [Oceanobacillus oncorhynchi]